MADLLIRDLAPDLITALDARANSLGISRVEFLRRTITREVGRSSESVSENHLARLVELLPDLANEEVMRGAWE